MGPAQAARGEGGGAHVARRAGLEVRPLADGAEPVPGEPRGVAVGGGPGGGATTTPAGPAEATGGVVGLELTEFIEVGTTTGGGTEGGGGVGVAVGGVVIVGGGVVVVVVIGGGGWGGGGGGRGVGGGGELYHGGTVERGERAWGGGGETKGAKEDTHGGSERWVGDGGGVRGSACPEASR